VALRRTRPGRSCGESSSLPNGSASRDAIATHRPRNSAAFPPADLIRSALVS
jgi:hypothetical protein